MWLAGDVHENRPDGVVAGVESFRAGSWAPKRGRWRPKPLYRDPVYDGAADPVLVWNRRRAEWWMFYTNRRANAAGLPGVSWVHGTRIGIAESADGGATWKYRGTADLPVGGKEDTHWAPDIVFHDGTYHMFLTFVPGTHEDWSGERRIVHLTSPDLVTWKNAGQLPFASDRVLDASVLQLADGTWRMWYNDEKAGKTIFLAESPDLMTWTDRGRAIADRGEGPQGIPLAGLLLADRGPLGGRAGRVPLDRCEQLDEAVRGPAGRSRHGRGRQGSRRPRRRRGLGRPGVSLLLHPSGPPARRPQDRHRAAAQLDPGRRAQTRRRPADLRPQPAHAHPPDAAGLAVTA